MSQGKETISEKDLRSWDELQEMISSEMIAQSTVDSYIKSLKIKKGKIDFEQFQKFMELLDGSMLDEDPEVSEWLNQK